MISNFLILDEMGKRNLDIQMAPIGNILSAGINKKGGHVEFGVSQALVMRMSQGERFVGGAVFANEKQFTEVTKELQEQATTPIIDPNAETTYFAVDEMRERGGSFVKCVAEAFAHADAANKWILCQAFSKYFISYGAKI